MAAPAKIHRPFPDSHPEIWSFFCPGCACDHHVRIEPGRWSLTGTPECPTIRPSVMCGPRVCHLFVTNGTLEYLADSQHGLSGKTIPMEDSEK